MVRKKRKQRKSDNVVFWKCTNCGYIYRYQQAPESCVVCDSGKSKFKKILTKESTEIEDFEIPERKKKYRRIFKKGFTRKYKKYSNN